MSIHRRRVARSRGLSDRQIVGRTWFAALAVVLVTGCLWMVEIVWLLPPP